MLGKDRLTAIGSEFGLSGYSSVSGVPQGIGKQLVAYLEERTDGPELWTSTNLSNQRMQRLLASRGFHITGFIDNLDPGDPELFYFKRLGR